MQPVHQEDIRKAIDVVIEYGNARPAAFADDHRSTEAEILFAILEAQLVDILDEYQPSVSNLLKGRICRNFLSPKLPLP